MIRISRTLRVSAVMGVALLALSACSRHHHDDDQNMDDANVAVEQIDNVADEAQNAAVAQTNATPELANAAALPAPKVTDDIQVRDDADATGLTARMPNDTPADAAQKTAPAK